MGFFELGEVFSEGVEMVGGNVEIVEEVGAFALGRVVEEAREAGGEIVEVEGVLDGFGDDVGGFGEELEGVADFATRARGLVVEGNEREVAGVEFAGEEVGSFAEVFDGFEDTGVEEFDGERVELSDVVGKLGGGFESVENGEEAVGARRENVGAEDDFGDDAKGAFATEDNWQEIEGATVVAADMFEAGVAEAGVLGEVGNEFRAVGK